ncbi:MAG: hypothetical protein FWF56_01565 [Firmicutes bacterium]|nr:hypothetical protein [Bacillota bacterium]MCL1954281.1 hypothetical protein [Bacillota bacterium]
MILIAKSNTLDKRANKFFKKISLLGIRKFCKVDNIESKTIDILENNYLSIKTIQKNLKKRKLYFKKLPFIGDEPRIFLLSRLALLSKVGLKNVLEIFNQYSLFTDIESEMLETVYCYSTLLKLHNVCGEFIQSYNDINLGLKDSKKGYLDMSKYKSPLYAKGYDIDSDIDCQYQYNLVLMQNNIRFSDIIYQANILQNKHFDLICYLLSCLQDSYNNSFNDFIRLNLSSFTSIHTLQYSKYPEFNLFYDGMYTAIIDSSGCGKSFFGATQILDGDRYIGGFNVFLNTISGVYSVYDNATRYQDRTVYRVEFDGVEICTHALILQDKHCDVRYITITNNSNAQHLIQLSANLTIHSNLKTVYKSTSIEYISSNKLNAKLLVLGGTASVNGGLLSCNISLQPKFKLQIAFVLDYINSNSFDSEFIFRQVQGYNTILELPTDTTIVLSKLMYTKKQPYVENFLKNNTLDLDFHTVVLSLQGLDYIKLKKQLINMRYVAKIIKYNLVILYVASTTQKFVLRKIEQLLDICELNKCYQIKINIFNIVNMDKSQYELLIQHSIFYEDNKFDEQQPILHNDNQLPNNILLQMSHNNNSNPNIQGNQLSFDLTNIDYQNRWYNSFSNYIYSVASDQFGNIVGDMQGYVALEHSNEIWSPSLIYGKMDSEVEYACSFFKDSTKFCSKFKNITSTMTVMIANSMVEYELELDNENSRKMDLNVLFFVPLKSHNNQYKTIVKGQDGIVVVDSYSDTNLYINTSAVVDSFCVSKESFCNQYGRIIKTRNLAESGGVYPCVAISSKISLKEKSRESVKYTLSNFKNQYIDESKPIDIDITLIQGDNVLMNAINWLPKSCKYINSLFDCNSNLATQNMSEYMLKRLYNILFDIYFDYSKARQSLIELANSGMMDIYYIIVLSRYCSVTEDINILDYRINLDGKPITIINYCLYLLNNKLVLGKRGLIINEDNKISVYDSMLWIWCIRQILPFIQDTQVVHFWINLADSLQDCINNNFWMGTHFGANTNSIDIRVQALAILSKVTDAHQTKQLYKTMHKALSQRKLTTHCIDSVHILKALLSINHNDLAYSMLQSFELMSNQVVGIFSLQSKDWHAALYDCLISDMLGLNISGKKITFDPILPQIFLYCVLQINIKDKKMNLEIYNSKSNGNWSMVVDKIKRNIATISMNDLLQNKTIVLTKSSA